MLKNMDFCHLTESIKNVEEITIPPQKREKILNELRKIL